jgi:nickel/cobalt exporter
MVMLLAMLFGLAVPAGAEQQPPRSPLGIATPTTTEQRGLTAGRPASLAPAPSVAPAGVLDSAWVWIEQQRAYFNRQMSLAVRSLKTEPLGGALLSLLAICFAYGVLHAAGPGHGKGVISAYALANNETVKRGIILSFMSGAFQAFSAIAIFLVLALFLNARKTDFDKVEGWLETLSWALVAAIGAWLLITRLRGLVAGRRHGQAHAEQHDHTHRHVHEHGHQHAHGSQQRLAHDHLHGHDGHAHAKHPHSHAAHAESCEACGHTHIPMPEQLAGTWSWRKAFGIAASVGIRPCTGALILLAFCMANGLLWAGVLGTFAMALGTSITISALAALAVGSRDVATWFAGSESNWGSRVGTAAGIVGSGLVFVMGSAFFVMSLNGVGPL